MRFQVGDIVTYTLSPNFSHFWEKRGRVTTIRENPLYSGEEIEVEFRDPIHCPGAHFHNEKRIWFSSGCFTLFLSHKDSHLYQEKDIWDWEV